jgi:hypothetical protein
VALPVAPINSPLFKTVSEIHENFTEQIGWPEMVGTVTGIYARLTPEEKTRAGILTGENDEAAAINLLGKNNGLPKAISGSDTFYLRGYGNPPPETLVVLGLEPSAAYAYFEECKPAGTITNQYGIQNDLSRPPTIYVCKKPRYPWPELWEKLKHYS